MPFKRSRVRSSPSPPKNTKSQDLVFFYPSRQAWHFITVRRILSTRLCRVASHHTFRCVFCRLDDMQNFVLMMYKAVALMICTVLPCFFARFQSGRFCFICNTLLWFLQILLPKIKSASLVISFSCQINYITKRTTILPFG